MTISLSLHFTFSKLSKRTGSRLFIGNDSMIKKIAKPKTLSYLLKAPDHARHSRKQKSQRISALHQETGHMLRGKAIGRVQQRD